MNTVSPSASRFNMGLITNSIALLVVITGLVMPANELQKVVLNTGLFALSGAVTNWLAVHMLFEKVPGLYGSGVIPSRFEDFKGGIKQLIMSQFFNRDNLAAFIRQLNSSNAGDGTPSAVRRLVDAVDLEAAYQSLVEVIVNSSFGSMLSMFGGAEALEPLKQPFIDKMQEFMVRVAEDPEFARELEHSTSVAMLDKIEQIVEQRLQELTPQLVKEIVQEMIRHHLGWLVVWGGVFGGLIGLVSGLVLL